MSAVPVIGPGAWPEVALSEVAELLRGVSYPKTDARDDPSPDHVPVLRATNIQDGRLVLDADLVYIATKNVSDEQRLREGDIVVATSSGSKHLVGKSALLRHSWSGSFGAFCAALRPKASINPRYLAAYLQSPSYRRQISKKALGVNINNLRRGDLETLSLPLPPLEAQEGIVAEIEKQFSRLDEAVASLKRVKANLKRYKTAILKAAVEGRLVPTEAELARREDRSYFRRYGLASWPEFLADFVRHWPTDGDHVRVEDVRDGELHARGGPAPGLRVGEASELRLCERWTSSAKSVFHFDVQGSVAKSTHAGIPWLKRLRDEAGERIHFWPFDGWVPAPGKSVVVEVYPSIFRNRYPKEGRTADEQDAYAAARWITDMATRSALAGYFAPPLTDLERATAEHEGWILAVM